MMKSWAVFSARVNLPLELEMVLNLRGPGWEMGVSLQYIDVCIPRGIYQYIVNYKSVVIRACNMNIISSSIYLPLLNITIF